jgi:hypothetical protein
MPTAPSSTTFVPFLDGPAASPIEDRPAPRDTRLPPLLPTPEMRQAKGRLESVGEVPTRDDELLAMNGWLAPDGTLYSCGYRTHDALCRALGFVHESGLEQAGYCKLSNWSGWCRPDTARERSPRRSGRQSSAGTPGTASRRPTS